MDKFVVKNKRNRDSSVSNEPPSAGNGNTAPVASTSTSRDRDPGDVDVISESETIEETIVNEDHHRQKKKSYKQKFRSEWLKEFLWLELKDGKNYCKVCAMHINGNVCHLRRHETSTSHVTKYKAAKKTPQITSLLIPNEDEVHLSKKISYAEVKLCAYIAEHNLPLSLMDTLPQLCQDIFPDSTIAKSLKIKRNKCTEIIVKKIAPLLRQDLINDLKTRKFSIIIDESTDVSTKKNLAIVCRYWKNNKVVDNFLGLVELESSTAQSIFNVLKDIMDTSRIPYKNLVAFGADNAAVMQGSINGVQALLRTLCPNIVVIGCSCHSLHLCTSQATKKLPSTIEQFTRDIYAYFAHSSKRLNELKECQVFANEKPHKILRPSQTRWLSLQAVVDRILEQWNPLNLYFQRASLEDNLPTAKAILNALRNPIYKLYLLFLSHILSLINKVNLDLQSEKPKAPILLEELRTLYKTILKYFIKKEILDRQEIIDIDIKKPSSYIDIKSIYFGANAELYLSNLNENDITNNDLHSFRLRCLDFYIELCTEIRRRFNFKDKHLNFISNFVPKVALSKLSLTEGFTLFPDINLNYDIVNQEWQLLSESKELHKHSHNLEEFWSAVNVTKNELGEPIYGNLMELVTVGLITPHSSATVERVFSQMFLIKTDIRNSLLVETVEAILHLQISVKQSGSTMLWDPRTYKIC
ncbi:hypothetical protein PPYR_15060 [Photinus pyralis]|uniref:HAT C-terminal dimerisation domain-containing protein n=1 Tax=Photinus pyralis TaxID=7054 RepID=A0A5N3ZZR5_PHOPY|nr:hypothetical protein PPYR_15060 [Photinus pyralis]